jgi:hypothetical protein
MVEVRYLYAYQGGSLYQRCTSACATTLNRTNAW